MDGVQIGTITIPAIKGDKGDKGDAGKIIGLSVIMLDSTATPTVVNTGTQYEANYQLGIPRGTGVSSAVINEDGELVFTLTDNTELNLGVIMPNSVASVSMNEDFDFIVTLTDGTETTVGNLAEEMEDVIETALADYYDKDTSDGKYALITETGNKIDLSINNTTYVMTLTLKDKNNNTLSTGTVDLPLESVVVSGSYDSVDKKIVLTLQSGSTVEFSVADLVSGLQSEITSSNKLSADLVDDTSTTHKFTTSANLTKLSGIETGAEVNIIEGITLNGSSLTPSSKVVALTNIERSTNKVTSLSSSSTDTEYPSAKCVYDIVGDIATTLDTIQGEVI